MQLRKPHMGTLCLDPQLRNLGSLVQTNDGALNKKPPKLQFSFWNEPQFRNLR
jgi:hypothetical protein